MHGARNQKRILAVDLRSRRFGFAVLEGPHVLLEWGVKSCPVSADEISRKMQKQIAPLLAFFSPEIIVLRHVASRNGGSRSCRELMLNAMEQEARQHSVEFVTVRQEEIECLFTKGERATKYEIACQVVLRFPELIWKLPPLRKSWMNEHHNMTVFDAVSAGLAYFDPPIPNPG